MKSLCYLPQIIETNRSKPELRTGSLDRLLDPFFVNSSFRQTLQDDIGIVKLRPNDSKHFRIFLRSQIHGKSLNDKEHLSPHLNMIRPSATATVTSFDYFNCIVSLR
jgi:hypothetical protein